MRKKFIFLAIILSACVSCKEDAAKTEPYDNDIYEIINLCLVHPPEEPVICGILPDRLTMEPYKENPLNAELIEKVFAEEDRKFVQTQLNDITGFNISHNKKWDCIDIVEEDAIIKMRSSAIKAGNIELFWDNYYKKFGQKALLSIGNPVFSTDKKTAVISFGYYRGPLSGFGYIYKLEKDQKGWKIIKILSGWIS